MNVRWSALTALLLVFLFWLSTPLLGCSSECQPGIGTECCADSDCPGNFSCGPNYICTRRCFSGEKDGCAEGYRCDDKGTGCVREEVSPQETTPDAGSRDTKPESIPETSTEPTNDSTGRG